MHLELVVVAETDAFIQNAASVADELGTSTAVYAPEDGSIYLSVGPGGVSLRSGNLSFRGDFSSLSKRLKAENLSSELLIRAAKIKNAKMPLRVLDATAGMGEDSFLLSAAGYEVTMYEHNPVIGVLLKDSLSRALSEPRTHEAAGRMRAVIGDSLRAIASLDDTPDIIYLDPMFPERAKNSAVKKKFQLIHRVEMTAGAGEDLLFAAIKANPRKIIVKRPAKGPFLGDIKPGYSLHGKTVRYDVILPAAVRKEPDWGLGDD